MDVLLSVWWLWLWWYYMTFNNTCLSHFSDFVMNNWNKDIKLTFYFRITHQVALCHFSEHETIRNTSSIWNMKINNIFDTSLLKCPWGLSGFHIIISNRKQHLFVILLIPWDTNTTCALEVVTWNQLEGQDWGLLGGLRSSSNPAHPSRGWRCAGLDGSPVSSSTGSTRL